MVSDQVRYKQFCTVTDLESRGIILVHGLHGYLHVGFTCNCDMEKIMERSSTS